MSQVCTCGRIAKLFLLTAVLYAVNTSLVDTSVAENAATQAAPAEGSYVILLRHGDAPGRNEPQNFNLSDCSTQRNLSDKGRLEAREVGKALRARGINVTKVLTSRWCRTRETAELLGFGPADHNLAFDNLEFNKIRELDLIERERKLIRSWHGPGALLIVTHSSNIKALTGFAVHQGEMIVTNPTDERDTVLHFGKVSLQNAPS